MQRVQFLIVATSLLPVWGSLAQPTGAPELIDSPFPLSREFG